MMTAWKNNSLLPSSTESEFIFPPDFIIFFDYYQNNMKTPVKYILECYGGEKREILLI